MIEAGGLRVQLIGGSVTSDQVILGSRRKQDEQAMRYKPVSSVPLWSLFQFLTSWFLPCLSFCLDFRQDGLTVTW